MRTLPAVALLFATTLACYWRPLTSSGTSILWDAADQFQPFQQYLSDELWSGRMPCWTPYLTAGYPFLADPQVGAWYPLNWPFFLVGVSPRVLVAEHFLHVLLACLGAYFLARRFLASTECAVLAGLSYGLSGFFVGHSSHTPMLQAAAWLPWLLYSFDRALASQPVRNTALGGLVAGMMILCGHFQTALYGFAALALYVPARASMVRASYGRAAIIAVAMPVIGLALSSISTAPGLELTLQSVRTSLNALSHTEGMLDPRGLATLVDPNYYGVLSGVENYRGPSDITQFYFYAGFALVPLALLGLIRPALRVVAVAVLIPSVWYALGHSAGLYLVIARLPGFASVRAPINIWFVPALALALLAAGGLAVISERWGLRWVALGLVILTAGDLFYRNSAVNPLAYSRSSYDVMYGNKQERFRAALAPRLPPLTRLNGADMLPYFGPLNHQLNARVETTYGYLPLTLRRYQIYFDAMRSNPKLRDGLNVGLEFDGKTRTIRPNPTALPRATFPSSLVRLNSAGEIEARLRFLDPSREALVPDAIKVDLQDANGGVEVRDYAPGRYVLHYRCTSTSVLRVSNAWFPGWTARLSDKTLEVFPVDYALIGVVVPPGEGDIRLLYRSTYFPAGACVSLVSLLCCLALIVHDRVGRRKVDCDRIVTTERSQGISVTATKVAPEDD